MPKWPTESISREGLHRQFREAAKRVRQASREPIDESDGLTGEGIEDHPAKPKAIQK
jgi:hypothetical protein